ncbi:MAG: purine-binding chemotaxis protein CheW [Candidatus Syntrophonatronum acetioxidans]|uniref:Purine-binding chemotaxis protein CheW n=1 Tax=Candidatus Syntrophonatronum acetioxidans TaxID=1795816 RepID=A0A424YEV6_9FIRM|nr:MAG: purine-binding chemotaxis protein CheW [Candidatus Syntrophonatronum acetioxidans]
MVKEGSLAKGEIQLVIFSLHGEEFGIDINQVKEVLKFIQVTHIPHTAEYVEGVINLRGEVIPVVNLRKRFDISDEKEEELKKRIIIAKIEGDLVGLIVDSVSEVLRLPLRAVESPSGTVAGSRSEFLRGVGKHDDRLIIILELDKIIATEEKISLADLQEWQER